MKKKQYAVITYKNNGMRDSIIKNLTMNEAQKVYRNLFVKERYSLNPIIVKLENDGWHWITIYNDKITDICNKGYDFI